MKWKGIIATSNTDSMGERFTSKSLENQNGVVPIFWNFDQDIQLGEAKLEYDPNLDVLFADCSMNVDPEILKVLKGGYIVPTMMNIERVYTSSEVSIIDKAQIISVGWTLTPADPNVTKIE